MKIRYIILLMILVIIAFFAGAVAKNKTVGTTNYAEYVLKKTSLPPTYAPSYCLHGFAGFRDTFEQTVFEVQYKYDREALMQHIIQADHWTVSSVTAEEYQTFSRFFWHPTIISVPESLVFDAWFYRETSEPTPWAEFTEGCFSSIGKISSGFEFAVYDIETGLFIFIDQFG